jgi:hypothetical protein
MHPGSNTAASGSSSPPVSRAILPARCPCPLHPERNRRTNGQGRRPRGIAGPGRTASGQSLSSDCRGEDGRGYERGRDGPRHREADTPQMARRSVVSLWFRCAIQLSQARRRLRWSDGGTSPQTRASGRRSRQSGWATADTQRCVPIDRLRLGVARGPDLERSD